MFTFGWPLYEPEGRGNGGGCSIKTAKRRRLDSLKIKEKPREGHSQGNVRGRVKLAWPTGWNEIFGVILGGVGLLPSIHIIYQ